jgi:hypothetical protein
MRYNVPWVYVLYITTYMFVYTYYMYSCTYHYIIYIYVCVGKLYKVCIYSIYALQVYCTYVSKYVNTIYIYTIYILCIYIYIYIYIYIHIYIYIESSFDAITPESPPLGPRDQFQLVQLAFPASVEGNPQAPQEGPMGRPHHSLLRLWRYWKDADAMCQLS